VPLLALLAYSVVVRPDWRDGPVGWLGSLLLAVALAAPVALIGGYLGRRKRIPPDRQSEVAAVASSLAFYVLLLPLAVGLLSARYVHWLFPSDAALFSQLDHGYADRVGIAAHMLWLPVWVAVIGLAALVAWRAGACARPDEPPAPPASAKFALVGLLAFTSCTLLVLADHRGDVLAQRVQIGDRLRPWAGLLVVTAEPVCITGAGAPSDPGPYMYLGKAGDKLVLDRPGVRDGDPDHTVFLIRAPDARITFVRTDIVNAVDRANARCGQVGVS
jgi:hypothetical protein